MQTSLRIYFSVLRRFKMATILNVWGLSIAFVAFMLIMMQVNYDQRFDSCQKNASSIFRMDLVMDKSEMAIISRPFAQVFTKSSPHIEEGCVMGAWTQNILFEIEQNGQRISHNEEAWNASPGILRVFQFDMVEGLEQSLSEPNSVIISKSMADKFFGNKSAIDKQLFSSIPEAPPMIVKGGL